VVGVSQRLLLRIGGVAGIIGGILTLAGNVAHPRESGQLDDAETLVRVVADSRVWVADHLIIMIGITMLLGAFFGLTHSITSETGRTWAFLAWGVAIIGVGLGIAFMLTEAIAMTALAEIWAASSGIDRDIALGAGSALFQLSLALSTGAALVLFGVAPVLVGRAILASNDYASWTGWVGLVAGAMGVAANLIQSFSGVSTQSGLVLVPIVIVAVTLWMVYLGASMLRRAAKVEVS
jgi:hypothetical protein